VLRFLTLDHKCLHTNVIAMAKTHELRYELLPYSSDLTPSDFNLFPRLKIFLDRLRFFTTEELIAEVEKYFAGLEECHFRDWIKALEHRWTKCSSLQGDYVENKNSSTKVRQFFLVHSENFSNHPCKIIEYRMKNYLCIYIMILVPGMQN
jgi:hypothetical protein